jgi:tetratricopeptide (TPR) repeat protein
MKEGKYWEKAMHSKKKHLVSILENKIRLLKILSRIPFYPWNYFFLGKEYLRMDEPLKAARNFMKAGEIVANKGYKNLTKTAYEEAKEIYQDLRKKNPALLERKDYANLGSIHAFFDPFLKDSFYSCTLYTRKESFFGGNLDVPWR